MYQMTDRDVIVHKHFNSTGGGWPGNDQGMRIIAETQAPAQPFSLFNSRLAGAARAFLRSALSE